MALLEWNDKMSVGVEALDADHRKLLTMVNDLHAVVRKKEPAETVNRVLDELIAYADYHFRTEEQLLRLARYPDFDAHVACHAALRDKAEAIRDRYREKPSDALALKAFDFLSDWLMRHILKEDMKYRDLMLRGRQNRAAG